MIRFAILNKQEKALWLPKLYDLLHENMCLIAPNAEPYEQEKDRWIAEVSPALDKAPRQIALCFVDDALAGFAQYYTRGDMVMVEELQIKREYQRTLVFGCFCRYLLQILPAELTLMEAYADKRNLPSQTLMQRLGMEVVDDAPPFVHFRGSLERARSLFGP